MATKDSTSSSSDHPSARTFLLRSRTQLRISIGRWLFMMDVLVAVHLPPALLSVGVEGTRAQRDWSRRGTQRRRG
jgi:hypothetical protein